MNQGTTLAELLADPSSNSPAIVSTSPPAVISYKALADQIEGTAERFSRSGLNPGDAVALILPNGIEFIVGFLALVRGGFVAAPANPASKADEIRRLLGNVTPHAIIADGQNSAAGEAAGSLGVTMWTAQADPSGIVTVEGISQALRRSLGEPKAEDVAMIASTSGTTGPPKTIPLTHANILWSARNTASHYGLNPADRSLLVLPLFHGHGLIGCSLSTLASGGTLIVPPRFSASEFWAQLSDHRVTWYSAVPTIHQILLMRADSDNAPRTGLRFIRSCSAPLQRAAIEELENRFGSPVVEAYGMTEASHQVASNPLPPGNRKPGTVGTSGAGVEVGVIDDAGRHLPPAATGEVIVRGPNVMRGYRNNPEANAASFIDGFFRTGDLGMLDSDGYLTLVGRIKELINRGGEKISPSEIESVLLEHPAVSEAVVFGVPDAKYGEEVAAAVETRGGCDATALQKFCRERCPRQYFSLPIFPGMQWERLNGARSRRSLADRHHRAIQSRHCQEHRARNAARAPAFKDRKIDRQRRFDGRSNHSLLIEF